MYKLIIILFLFTTVYSFGDNKKQGTDIISYNLDMKLDTVSNKIDVQAVINIINNDNSDIVKLLFRDWIKINKAQLNGLSLNYNQGKDTLLLQVKGIKNLHLTLNYALPVDSFKQDKVITLTRAMKWCPFIYDDISKLNSKITVPQRYIVYSAGNLVKYNENASTYEFSNKINSGFPFIIAPPNYYSENKTRNGNTIIKYYFHNQDSVLTNSIIKESISGFDFATKYICRYKKSSLIYIESPAFDNAQSLETVVLMGPNFINYFGLYPDIRFWPSHETIHQWIGAGYFNSISSNNKNRWFIEESLTEYLRYIFVEKTYGTDSLKTEIKKSINYYYKEIKGTKQDLPIIANLPNDIAYCIGPLIFHSVREGMGDKNWHKFIITLYAKYYGKVLDYDGFKKVLSKFAKPSVILKMESSMETKGVPKEFTNY